MNALATIPQNNVEIYRASTDAAGLCKDIVVQTAKKIGDRNYVQVEGWQAIAVAHGCAASAGEVERINGGVRAIGEVRRMADGALIARAEGFVGEDEPVWFGGVARAWKWGEKRGEKIWYDKTHEKRPDYAIRAMAQTRAISRACRSAFAHVVVMMNAGLSTTPAEEVPDGGFIDADYTDTTATHAEAKPADPKGKPAEKAYPHAVIDGCRVAIELCGNEAALDEWLAEKTEPMGRLKADHPKAHADLLGFIEDRRTAMRGDADSGFGDISGAAASLGKAA